MSSKEQIGALIERVGLAFGNLDVDAWLACFHSQRMLVFPQALMTDLSDKEVIYKTVEVELFKKIMLDNGIPEPMVKKIVGFNLDIKNVQEATVTNELQHYLGRKPKNLKEGLKIVFNL